MAWYHVGSCDCPIGCCDCGDTRDRYVHIFYHEKSDQLFIFTDKKIGTQMIYIDSFHEDKTVMTDDEIEAIEHGRLADD